MIDNEMPEIRIFAERSPHMTSIVHKSKGGDEAAKLTASRVSFVSGRVRRFREQVIMERKTAAFRQSGKARHWGQGTATAIAVRTGGRKVRDCHNIESRPDEIAAGGRPFTRPGGVW